MKRQYIYNKVKGIALMSFTAFVFSSCSDFLEIKPQSEIILEDFWNEKADVDNIVSGCYAALEADPIIRRMIIWGECRADNVMAGLDSNKDGDLFNIFKENINAKNVYTTWSDFYGVINRCNTVIKYAPGVAERDPGYTQSDLKATLAEVTALRSLCYFYLIRTFRDVPYSTEAYTDDDQVMDLAATSFDVVLSNLINDLEAVKGDAVVRYPETKPAYQTGRITRDAIYAMLCEMYLWQKDYANCIKYADMVINSRTAYYKQLLDKNNVTLTQQEKDRVNGFPLVDNIISNGYYGAAFNSLFVSGNTIETIFELVYDNDKAGDQMLSNSAAGFLYGNSTVQQGRIAASNKLVEDVSKVSSRTFFDDQNKKMDARQYANFDKSGGGINKFVKRGISISTATTDPECIYPNGSYSYAKINNQDHYYTSSNWIIYRVSDILLLKAEALCQQMREGSDAEVVAYNKPLIDEAFYLVNAVNKRSVCQNPLVDTLVSTKYTTKSLMEELVMQERQRELMFEGKRWYDLVRRSLRDGNTNKLVEAVGRREGPNIQLAQNFFSGSKWDWAIFWPYFYEETTVNKNLTPNPAYDSGDNSSIK